MKAGAVILLCVLCYVQCRKIVPPIDKHANTAFINIEGGGINSAAKPKQTVAPTQAPKLQPVQPSIKPAVPASPVQPSQAKPASPPNPAKPLAANPPPAAKPAVTTPGPGSVKQLVNFYDSQGKHSVIRPHSYSQAVKQG